MNDLMAASRMFRELWAVAACRFQIVQEVENQRRIDLLHCQLPKASPSDARWRRSRAA